MTDEGSNGAKAIVGVDIECLERVKTGKARWEHMFSALPPKADITLRTRHVRFVPPITDISRWASRQNAFGAVV
jgi:hypothetical protein